MGNGAGDKIDFFGVKANSEYNVHGFNCQVTTLALG